MQPTKMRLTQIETLLGLSVLGLTLLSALPQTAAAQNQMPAEMRREARAVMQSCRSDYRRLCEGVQPGGGRILACLENHGNQLTPGCSGAMPRAEALKARAVEAGMLPQ